MCAIIVYFDHVISDLNTIAISENTTVIESPSNAKFIEANGPTVKDLQGCYLHYDNKNKRWIRSGKVSGEKSTFGTRQKQHKDGASDIYTFNKFYMSYPNKKTYDDNTMQRGIWDDLIQYCGLGIDPNICNELISTKNQDVPLNEKGINYSCIFEWDNYTMSR